MGVPAASKMMAREEVVPWSIASTSLRNADGMAVRCERKFNCCREDHPAVAGQPLHSQ